MRRHVYYYTHVDTPQDAVARTVCDDPALWLPAPARVHDDAWEVDLHADGALPRALADHRVRVTVGAAASGGGRALRAITWRSVTAPGLFPVFDGDLEVADLWGEGCQLSLMGTYRPPLSVAGAAGDAVLGHRVAEACIRRFVLDVAGKTAGVTLGT